MYAVSDAYKQAVTGDAREFKIRANIYFRDQNIQTFDDSTIENEVMIESKMMAGSPSDDTIDIGAATSKRLTMTVKNNKTDLRRFAGARLWLYVSLRLDNGAFEDVPMGKFFIDNKSVSRVGDQVTFSAYDGMILLHYELTNEIRAELKGKTALEAAQILCGGRLAVVPPKSPEGAEVTLPNSELELDFDSEQIETARDGIMWIAQLMGCFARVNRLGQLEFVQIKSWWKMYDETTGTILAVRNIQGDQRFKTKFADERIHIVGVSMRGADNKLVTQRYSYSHSGEEDPTSDVTVEMATNPLIISSNTPLSEILGNILAELSTAYFYSFSTEMANDPALDAGDTIRLQGGVINGTNHNNDLIGFITHNVWRYRGHQEITNASSVPIVFDGGDSESGTPARLRARSASAARSDDDLNFLPPKPQSEKALQGVKVKSDTIVTPNGASLTIKDVLSPSSMKNSVDIEIKNKNGAKLCDVRVDQNGGFSIYTYSETVDPSRYSWDWQWRISANGEGYKPYLSALNNFTKFGFDFGENSNGTGRVDFHLGKNINDPSSRTGVQFWVDNDTGKLVTNPYYRASL